MGGASPGVESTPTPSIHSLGLKEPTPSPEDHALEENTPTGAGCTFSYSTKNPETRAPKPSRFQRSRRSPEPGLAGLQDNPRETGMGPEPGGSQDGMRMQSCCNTAQERGPQAWLVRGTADLQQPHPGPPSSLRGLHQTEGSNSTHKGRG